MNGNHERNSEQNRSWILFVIAAIGLFVIERSNLATLAIKGQEGYVAPGAAGRVTFLQFNLTSPVLTTMAVIVFVLFIAACYFAMNAKTYLPSAAVAVVTLGAVLFDKPMVNTKSLITLMLLAFIVSVGFAILTWRFPEFAARFDKRVKNLHHDDNDDNADNGNIDDDDPKDHSPSHQDEVPSGSRSLVHSGGEGSATS